MQKYEEAMALIAHAARLKMQLNSHKGDIEMCPPELVMQFAKDEIDELGNAWGTQDWERVITEAGDTLNFLVSLVHNAVSRYRNRKSSGGNHVSRVQKGTERPSVRTKVGNHKKAKGSERG